MPAHRLALVTLVFAALPLVIAAAPDSPAASTSPRSHIVRSVGPYVERGTPRIQVVAKLGQPTARLDSDLWVYRPITSPDNRCSESGCRILLVRFVDGAVAELWLANEPAVPHLVARMQAPGAPGQVAAAEPAAGR